MRERIAVGAERAGRDPSQIHIAAYLPTCVDPDGERAVHAMRAQAARYLGLHGASAITECAGLPQDLCARYREDFLSGRKLDTDLPEQIIDKLLIAGTPEKCKARIQAYRDAGVDMPIIYEATGAYSPEESLERIERYLMD